MSLVTPRRESVPLVVPSSKLKAGRYYHASSSLVGTDSTNANALDLLIALRFDLWRPQTFDRIAIEVTTGVATALTRLGIYKDDGESAPGSLVLDAGTVDCSTTGLKEITISQVLESGRYWLASVAQTAAATLRAVPFTRDPVVGSSTGLNTGLMGYTQGSVTGALPATFTPAVGINGATGKVMLRAA